MTKIWFPDYDTAESVDLVGGKARKNLRMKLKKNTVDEEEEDEEEEDEEDDDDENRRRTKTEDVSQLDYRIKRRGESGVISSAIYTGPYSRAGTTDNVNPPYFGASDAERETARGQHTGGRGT